MIGGKFPLVHTGPISGFVIALVLAAGCGGGPTSTAVTTGGGQDPQVGDNYIIGPGDGLHVFVWGHNDLTTSIQVRPDGLISTPLVEDIQAAGKTPTELARDMETVLAEFVRSPTVTIIVQSFVGEYAQQIRVVGQAAEPKALPYRAGMTVLDVVIAVGGLSEFAAGNRARVVRRQDGQETTIKVRLNDLLNKGEMDQNVRMMPGDVLVIPESIF
jgi:polysaccharide export outer membrane protein